jgi:hypothetical protein
MKCIYCHSDVELLEAGYGWIEGDEPAYFHIECLEVFDDVKLESPK